MGVEMPGKRERTWMAHRDELHARARDLGYAGIDDGISGEYRKRGSCEAVGAVFGRSHAWARAHLRRLGLLGSVTRVRYWYQEEIEARARELGYDSIDAAITGEYRRLHSLVLMAEQFCRTEKWARYSLERIGEPIRPRGGRHDKPDRL